MNPTEIAGLLKEKFGDRIVESKPEGICPASVVDPTAVVDVCGFLRSGQGLEFDHLELLGGVDYKDRVEVVYVLTSLKHGHRYALKCRLPRDNPRISSVETIWAAANWHEREAFDMFGIVFAGHSDLRRILCPDDWEGYPLRKDYKMPTRYRDMPV